MSDYSEEEPLEFASSDQEYVDRGSEQYEGSDDSQPAGGDEPQWQPEVLELFQEHNMTPFDLNEEEGEPEDPYEEGMWTHVCRTCVFSSLKGRLC